MEVNSEEYHSDEFVKSVANAIPSHSSTARIHRVPQTVKEIHDYEKYYTPKVVSIGPYHFGKSKYQSLENLKAISTMKLVADNKEILKRLYKTLGAPSMVQELRNFYTQGSTDEFSDELFTKMMVLDGCFIWYYIRIKYTGERWLELRSHQMVFIHEDLLLLENQIPYKVLDEIIKIVVARIRSRRKVVEEIYCHAMNQFFSFNENILGQKGISSRGWKGLSESEINNGDHLLHLMHYCITKQSKLQTVFPFYRSSYVRWAPHPVNELMDAGIHFKPIYEKTLSHIEFVRGWRLCTATVKLPPISVNTSTKTMLLNLIAYEMCSPEAHERSWVTSYISFLDSVIDKPEDVMILKKVGVLDISTLRNDEVATLFKEIGTDLVPIPSSYYYAKYEIARHYYRFKKVYTSLSQFKREYVYSPWAFLAVVGAVLALFLTAVQTYYTVWSPESKCDDLCAFLKMNHHL